MIETSLSMRSFYAILAGLLKKNKPCRIKTICKGYSMSPFIKNNDRVIIRSVDSTKKLGVGTIAVIAHQEREKVVIHRIIETKGQLYLTKGDNVPTPDGWIRNEQIIGTVETVIKKHFSFNCKTPVNFMIAHISRVGLFSLFNKGLSYAFRLRRRILGTV